MEPVSTIVIKVKYGDMMRRFIARITGGGLDVSLDELKVKIFSSFSIAPDGELILTYIDEDGDVVHLVDDDDLRDVVKQSLNPVRITATLNSQLNAGDGSSTSVRQPLDDLQAGVTEVLKALPEPFRETLVNLSPHVFEIVDAFSKVGLSYIDQSSNSQPGAQPSKNNEPENSSLSKDRAAVKINIVKPVEPKVLSTSRKEQPVNSTETLKNAQLAGEKKSEGRELGNASGKEEDKVPLRPSSLRWEHTGPRRVCRKPKLKKVKDLMGDFEIPSQFHDRKMKIDSSCDLKHSGPSLVHGCPSGMTDGGQLSYLASCPPVFHSGVHCDGCGIYPITGPRFKSNVKFNYDLCLICYAKMGNSIDYIRMDHPEVVHRNHDPLNRLCNSAQMKPHKARPSKLDSCFIEDVNVFDGTVMAPLTPFTKIWRMRNNGTAEWPHGTQLVCIGGDLLRTSLSVEMEVPKFGVPVGQMLDIAVEFIAPERPGQYISYWRMLSPSGKQFGQRVWVLIEVDTALSPVNNSNLNLNIPALSCSPLSSMGINLDPVQIDGSTPLPQAENNKETVEPVVEMQHPAENHKETVEPVPEAQPQTENNNKTVEIVEPVVEAQPQAENNKKIVEIVEPVVEMQPQTESNKKIVETVEPVVEMQPQTENNKKIVEIVEPVVEMQSQTENNKKILEIVEPVIETQSQNLNNKNTLEIVEPVIDVQPQTKTNELTVELVEPVDEAQSHKSQEINFPINDNLLVGNDASSSLVTIPSNPFLLLPNSSDSGALNSGTSIPDPTGIVINSPSPSASVSTAQESDSVLPGKMEVEEKLLKELEEMGFTEVRLNKEVLRMNEYDLEQAVDDLCDVSEWDPMLEELEEMGFCDTKTNKQLLEKNKGSIMRVVMDLIAGEDND